MEIAPQTAKRRSTTQNKIGKQLLWVYSKWAWSGGTKLRIVPCCAREHRCENHAYPVQRSRASNGQRLRRPGGPDPNSNTNVKAPGPMPIKTVWPTECSSAGWTGFPFLYFGSHYEKTSDPRRTEASAQSRFLRPDKGANRVSWDPFRIAHDIATIPALFSQASR
jgi:hypothetical protein